ncbi:MAG: EAL domain-containing protein [Gammaproteobacteria bacterium]
MASLINFINKKSIRKQYLLIAIFMAIVVLSYTWYSGIWVQRTGQASVQQIEKRIDVAVLAHKLRRAFINADNALNLFLLAPSPASRNQFNAEIEHAQSLMAQLLRTRWLRESGMLPRMQELSGILEKVKMISGRAMHVRQDANLLYPALRFANGDMLGLNRNFVVQIDLAIRFYNQAKYLNGQQHQLEELLINIRDKWQRMINAYRVFIINRTGGLFEAATKQQLSNVEMYYAEVRKLLDRLKKDASRYSLDLEVKAAIESIQESGPAWYANFKKVVTMYNQGQWRADIPLVKNQINPLFNSVYDKLDLLDNRLKQSSDRDVVDQARVSGAIISSQRGMALFVLVIGVLSYIILELNFIRPIAKVARSLKAEAKGLDVMDLPDVQAVEIRDLTDAFRELRQQVHSRQMALEHIALHDSLTSLPNRALLMDRLNQSITVAQRQKNSLALLMLDLNRFKEINDTLGHQTGDALLQQVGERLRNVLRDSDTVARLGGDEFAVLLPNISDTNALRIAAAIHERLEQVYEVYEHSLYVGVSIGVAVFPQHGESSESLLQHADVAMYIAKRGNSGITLYDVERDKHSVSHLSVLTDLRGAVENEEFILQYQPKLAMRDNSINGAEALLRWKHPRRGLMMPDDFINVAEQTGLIKRLSNWVLDTAIRDCQHLHQQGYLINISVNLSVWDIQDPNIGLNITQKLEKWGLPAQYLTLEITERVMMAEPERAREVLIQLDNMGVQVVIDDFGTGFSSLVYLKQLPVSMLKVDKSFVIDMMKDENDAAIVHSIIELAHNLGLQTVAEGVENDQTWSWLRTWDCDYAQGYYISHPLALAEFAQYLATYKVEKIIG